MQTDPHATARLWSSEDTDDGTIHALGNGQLCAYAQGPNLAQVFGPPYSAPSLYQLTLAMPERTTASGHRTPGTAIWTHQLRIAGTPAGEIIDFVDIVRREDIPICESVQKGLHSFGYEGGHFVIDAEGSEISEHAVADFQAKVMRALGE